MYIAQETAICCNPPINYFTENRKKLDQSHTDQQLRMLSFYENIRASNFFVNKSLTAHVFVTQLSINTGITV
jgi:hypothetical protein